MSLPKERISFLLEAYTTKTATAEQEQELMEWIQEAKEDAELKSFMQSLWDKYEPGIRSDKVNWDRMFETIMQKEKVHSIVRQTRRIHLSRIAAAVFVLLLLSAAGYFYINKNNSQKQIATTETKKFTNDIQAPKSNKAVLTLSDGSKIVLDSAGKGSLAQQGNVKVEKTADGQIVYKGDATEIKYNTLTVPRGSKPVQLQLADGSQVWLNVASSITYPTAFAGTQRKVQITGEAYFEVAHNPSMPFIVEKNDVNVEVLGTHFNVNTYDDEAVMKITLLEGSVKVSRGNKRNLLKPGQQAVLGQTEDNNEIKVADADVDQAVAWKNGLFSLNKTDMQTFMRMISRWYDVDVVYEGGIPKGTISGDVQRSLSFAQMQKVLQLTDLHFRIEGKKMTITH